MVLVSDVEEVPATVDEALAMRVAFVVDTEEDEDEGEDESVVVAIVLDAADAELEELGALEL